jgi:hypothetical protein
MNTPSNTAAADPLKQFNDLKQSLATERDGLIARLKEIDTVLGVQAPKRTRKRKAPAADASTPTVTTQPPIVPVSSKTTPTPF